jgi:hypothetical protein
MLMDNPPRYRIEHRHPDLATAIVAFADMLPGAHLVVGIRRHRQAMREVGGALVIVNQETEADIKSFSIAD